MDCPIYKAGVSVHMVVAVNTKLWSFEVRGSSNCGKGDFESNCTAELPASNFEESSETTRRCRDQACDALHDLLGERSYGMLSR